jgi:hypothetical protein
MDIDASPAAAAAPWKVRDIRWGEVFLRQDYANLILTALMIVSVVVTDAVASPRANIYFIYDASISYPGTANFKPTIPSWVAVVVPLLVGGCAQAWAQPVHRRRQ